MPRVLGAQAEFQPDTRRSSRVQVNDTDTEQAYVDSGSDDDELQDDAPALTELGATAAGKELQKLFADLNDMNEGAPQKETRVLHEANVVMIGTAHRRALEEETESDFQAAFCDAILLTVGTPKTTPLINVMVKFCVQYCTYLVEIINGEDTNAALVHNYTDFIQAIFAFVADGIDVRNRTYRKRFMKFTHDFLLCKAINPLFEEQRGGLLPKLLDRCRDVDSSTRMMAISAIRAGYQSDELDGDATRIFEFLTRSDPSGTCRAKALRALRKNNDEMDPEDVPKPVNDAATKEHWKQVAKQSNTNVDPDFISREGIAEENNMDEVILRPVFRGIPTIMEDEFDYLHGVLNCVHDSSAVVRSTAYSILKTTHVSPYSINKWGAERVALDNQVPDFLLNRVLRGVNDSVSVRKATMELIKSWLPKKKRQDDSVYSDGFLLLLKEFDVMLGTDSVQRRSTLPLAKEDAMMLLFNDPAIIKENTSEWLHCPGLVFTNEVAIESFQRTPDNDNPKDRGKLMAEAMNGEIATQEETPDERRRDRYDTEDPSAKLLMNEAQIAAMQPLVDAMTPEKATYIRLICKRCYLTNTRNAPVNFDFDDAPDINDLITFTIAFFESKILDSSDDGDAMDLDGIKATNDYIYGQLLHAISYNNNLEKAIQERLRSHVEMALCHIWDVGSNSTLLMKVLRRLVKVESSFLEIARELFDSISPNMEADKRWDAQLTMLQAILSNVKHIDINKHQDIYSDFSGPVFLCFNQDGRPRKEETAAECMQLMGLLALVFPAKAPNLVQIMVKRYNELMEEASEKQIEMNEDIENYRRQLARLNPGSVTAGDIRSTITQLEQARPIPETWDERRYILQIICDAMLEVNFIYAGCTAIILEGLETNDDPELQSICCSVAAKLVFGDVWAPHEDHILSVFVRLYYQQFDLDRSPRSHDSFSIAYPVVETLEFFFAFYHRAPHNALVVAQIFPQAIFDAIRTDLEFVVAEQSRWRAYDDSRHGEIEEPGNRLELDEINGYFSRFRGATSNFLNWSNNMRQGEIPDYNSHATVMISLLKEVRKVSPKLEKETKLFHEVNRNNGGSLGGADLIFYRVYERYADRLFDLAKEVAVNDCSSIGELKTMIELATELIEHSSYLRKHKLILKNLLLGFEKLKALVVERVGDSEAEPQEENESDNSEVEIEEPEPKSQNAQADVYVSDFDRDQGQQRGQQQQLKQETHTQGVSAPSPAILDGLSSDEDEHQNADPSSAQLNLDVSSIVAGVESTPRTTPRSSLAVNRGNLLRFIDDDSSLLADQSSILESSSTPAPSRLSSDIIPPQTIDLLGSESEEDSIDVVAVVQKKPTSKPRVKTEKSHSKSSKKRRKSDATLDASDKKHKKKRRHENEPSGEPKRKKKEKRV